MWDGEPASRKLLWTSCALELQHFVAKLPYLDELLRRECLIHLQGCCADRQFVDGVAHRQCHAGRYT